MAYGIVLGMKQSKYLNDPVLKELVEKIAAGDMTREEAAGALGVTVGTFNSRLIRAKLSEQLRPLRKYDGDHLFKPDPDKAKAYEEAIAYAKAHPRMMLTKVHQLFPSLSYQMLARKVKAAAQEEQSPSP